MKIYPLIKLAAILIMVSGLCACQQDPVESAPQGKKTLLLQLKMSDPTQITRAVDDNAIKDLNIYFYSDQEAPDYHVYLTDVTSLVPIEYDPYGYYDIHVVANMHYDMGDYLTGRDLVDNTTIPQTIGETLPMEGHIYALDARDIIPGLPIPIQLDRCVAKINYNITLAPGTADGIDITSVEFRSIPKTTYLISKNYPAPTTAASYRDVSVFSAPEGSRQPIEGVFYMPDNPQGTNSAITDQKQKNAANAPKFASFILIRAKKENKILAYYIYLGENNTSSFNVRPNQEHTMNINIINDSEVDTRITSYAIDVYDDWTEEYNTCDAGTRLYTNIVGHNLMPGAKFSAELECLELDDDRQLYLEHDNRWYPSAGLGNLSMSGETSWPYEFNLDCVLVTSSNNFVRYRVTISDGAGAMITKTLERKFANSISAYYPPAAGRVVVTNALRTIPASTSGGTATIAGVCLEDGCTFTALPEVGYAFEGWYSDQACTKLLSSNAQYRHRPTSALDKIYTKWNITTSYTFDINCTESNKNSTYMFNTNSVSIKSGNYTGKVTVEINNLTGGVLATQQSYPLTINAGQTLSLGEVKFVPTQVGEVSYAIVVKNTAGIPIASKTITNTAVATKLTPTIEIGYSAEVFGAYYDYGSTPTSWSGYKNVHVIVTFSPMLDYPAPLGDSPLLQVNLSPRINVYELDEVEDYMNPGYWTTEKRWLDNTWPMHAVTAHYANDVDQSDNYYTAASVTNHPDEFPAAIFAPHTDGQTYLQIPQQSWYAIQAKMLDRPFVEFKMNKNAPQDSEIQLVSKQSGIPLVIETNIRRINYTNNLF